MQVGRTWSAWQRKSTFLASETLVRTDVTLPQDGRGRLGSGWLLRGTLAMTDLGLLPAASQKPRRGTEHPWYCGANLQGYRASTVPKQNTAIGRGTPEVGGRLRGPNRLGNLDRGQSGWYLGGHCLRELSGEIDLQGELYGYSAGDRPNCGRAP